MNWENCYSNKRTGRPSTTTGQRTGFQRDFDRLIFSSAFRRLQDKTQVFPLPGSTFVHNRLTHSLEVASVGRSLGNLIGEHLAQNLKSNTSDDVKDFYLNNLSTVVASACIAHDIGNPAFGHSGEDAISNYFSQNEALLIDGQTLRSLFDEKEWQDLISFEGNANAFRILTHQFKGKMAGGMQLTYATLMSIMKYPCEATAVDKSWKHRKKYGFFQSEKDSFLEIAEYMSMYPDNTDDVCYRRHPFVYLVEAADDICYRIIDMEDAHRIGILSKEKISDAFLSVIQSIPRKENNMIKIKDTFHKIGDDNEAIAYLRAKTINTLILQSTDNFIDNKNAILEGSFNDTLVDIIDRNNNAMAVVNDISINEIYNHNSVVEVEMSGYNVMYELLDIFLPAVLENKSYGIRSKAVKLIPKQFTPVESDTMYEKTRLVLDFISGMTDTYATEMYRKIKGIDIAKHN